MDTEANSHPNLPSVCHTDEPHKAETAVCGATNQLNSAWPPSLAYSTSVAGWYVVIPMPVITITYQPSSVTQQICSTHFDMVHNLSNFVRIVFWRFHN